MELRVKGGRGDVEKGEGSNFMGRAMGSISSFQILILCLRGFGHPS